MRWLPSATICAALIAASVASNFFIVGPASFRSNRNYTMFIQNFKNKTYNLEVSLEGFGVEGSGCIDRKNIVLHPNKLLPITLQLPCNGPTVSAKLTIEGTNYLTHFHQEVDLEYEPKTIRGFIQLSKPVYKPDDSVQFRVIVLDSDLKPPSDTNMVNVTVQDLHGNNTREWCNERLYNGVFHGEFGTNSGSGSYNIKVEANKGQLVSKTFDVKDYTLFPIEVDVSLTTFPLEKHQALNLTIQANYYFGNPVTGTMRIELYDNDGITLSEKPTEMKVYGTQQVHLRFAKPLNIEQYEQNVRVHVNFTEKFTNRTVKKIYNYKVYKYMYQAKLEQMNWDHEPQYSLKITHGDTPAKAVTVLVKEGSESSKNYTTDEEGIINLSLNSTQLISVSYASDEILSVRIDPLEKKFSSYITVTLQSDVKRNEKLRVKISCSHQITFVTYYVVSKGNIVEAEVIRVSRNRTHSLDLIVTDKLLPRSTILFVTMVNNTLVYDYVYIEHKELAYNFDLKIMDEGAHLKPGGQIRLKVTAPKRAYVALTAYEKSFLNDYDGDHDILFEDIWKVFDKFHKKDENYFNFFHTLGLFSLPVIRNHTSGRSSRKATSNTYTSHIHRSKIVWRAGRRQNWLWKNVTIPDTRQITLDEHLPNALTSWYLSGFCIDPVHGFEIIKKPLELTTTQPFFIVDYLPNSIKLDEQVKLKFMLFSTIGGEYKAKVTLYNVNNTIKFFDCSTGDEYCTRYLSVPTKHDVLVSFLVKGKQTGNMIVRVNASISDIDEHDGLEQIIRVVE